MTNRITTMLQIKYPLVQAGMVWCSGWELASAVSNAGGLGLIGAGSMNAETLRIHIRKTKAHTANSFGVNVPLLYSNIEETMDVLVDEHVKVVVTSAGNPSVWTKKLKDNGILVMHVVANVKFAKKCEDSGVDAIIAEGVEAGGHNGREETTTMVLVPLIRANTSLPIVAAGGIASGKAMLAAMALGAEGVQVGSRFVASTESSAHQLFKEKVIETSDGGTRMALKNVSPVRLIRNELSTILEQAEQRCADADTLRTILGKGRSRLGMFEGNITDGELEIGQAAALIHTIKPAADIIDEMITEYNVALKALQPIYN